MHALDAPVAARAPGNTLDVERRRTDIVVGIEGAPIGVFGAGKDLDDGLDVGETRLARVASAAENPIDDAGSRIGARLDAAMSFLDGGFGDGFGGGAVRK
jgi:hypothetical protein